MKAVTLATAAFMAALATACHPAAHRRVVIDDWWNVDYAKNVCQTPAFAEQTPACAEGDPTNEVRSFETEMTTYFASTKECAGISIGRFEGPDGVHSKGIADTDWDLMINYIPGHESQNWNLAKANGPLFKATGTARQIAAHVCIIVHKQGAAIEEP